MPAKLKLSALDADDLGVISAAVQDALVAVRDCAYFAGEKVGEKAGTAGGTLPTAATLNEIAQQYFNRQGSGEPMAWKHAFEHGYEDGFKKTQRAP